VFHPKLWPLNPVQCCFASFNLNGVFLGSKIVLPCCQTIARFPNIFYFPLGPVAKFGSDFFVNQDLSLWWPPAHLPHKIAKAKNPGTHQCGLGILFCNTPQFQVFEKIQKIKELPVPSIWKFSESKNLWFQVFQKLQTKMGVQEGTSKDLIWILWYHDMGTCEIWARAEGTGTISTNATGRCAAGFCYFCGSAEYIWQCCCNWRGQVCSWADHSKWMEFKCLCGELLGWHVCKMWEHGAGLESVQQDAITWCGLLECHTWMMWNAWAWKGSSETFWTDVCRRCKARWYHFCLSSVSL